MSFGSRLEFMGKGSPLLARLLKRGRGLAQVNIIE
jgi:hypothetical protein